MSRTNKFSAIQFAGGKISVVEMTHSGDEFELTSIIEREGSQSYLETLSPSSNMSPSPLEALVNDLRSIRKDGDIEANNISICLDSRWVFIHTFPIDDGSSETERANQITWELSNYLGPAVSEGFVTGTAKLRELLVPPATLMLSASAKRELISLFRQVAVRLELNLAVIDVDHFGAEHALKWNYPEIRQESVVLLGVKLDRVEATLIHYGRPIEYRWAEVVNGKVGAEFVEYFLSQRSNGKPLVKRFFLYTEEENPWKLSVFDEMIPLPVETIDPVRRLRLPRRLRRMERATFHRYAPVIGIAMRKE